MDQPIEMLTSNPVYMAVAVVLAIIILLGVIKKLIKLVIVVSAILILWVAYMVYTDQDVTVDSIKRGLQSGVETVKDKASDIGEKTKKSAVEKMEEKVEENLNELLPKKE
ncbi:MAG: hypothetical protein HOE72_06050 [Candidatus Marinimicrobia bacterium]|jgi:hypothetical protein|nr:hypothetical protein [Candidatus Neomarinimicrobiota bacterium]MBT4064794.1 hypothetical protein [Candidatus Neomarinimicrobiota bacterium]MCP4930413.1 hypothetical protein [Candidatus Neomarinimicrobiota bacterium]MDP6033430.1 hypothetical protein [Candidatus Neomarinimicrobiota bacterium]MDP6201148.1 hypothetical protein [Candidatus Neomarinimicrobiota bacterium]|tara:strand:- start:5537 stop:5866 length:330 start_codon:yes stop_codon:yes gene_type:complete